MKLINCVECGQKSEVEFEDDLEVTYYCVVCEEETTLYKDVASYAETIAQGVAKACGGTAKK